MTETRSEVAQPIVVDTNVVSFSLKNDTRSALYRPHLLGRLPILSFMTVAELHGWAEERRWGAQRKMDLERFLRAYAIHYPDLDLCKLWATVTVAARRASRPIGAADAWIAATALLYGVPLVTHDPRDFAGVTGLKVLTEVSVSR